MGGEGDGGNGGRESSFFYNVSAADGDRSETVVGFSSMLLYRRHEADRSGFRRARPVAPIPPAVRSI